MMLQLTRNNLLRRVSAPILTILVAMLLTVAAWGQSLDKGTYTISNTVTHDNPVGQGMARSYTEETADVEVNDSGTFVALSFNNTQYMGEFTISVGGSKVSYETTALGNNVKKLKFKVPSLSSSIKVGLYVQPMDTTVEYTVTLNESSLKLIKKAEPEAVETTQSTVNGTNNTADNSTSNKTNSTADSNAASNTNSSQTGNTTSKQEQAAQKAPEQQAAETVKKTDIAAQSALKEEKPADTKKTEVQKEVVTEPEAVRDESVQAGTEEITEAAEQITEVADQEAVETQEAEVQDKVQDETQGEDTALDAAESTETAESASQGSMTTILLVVGAITLTGAIGFGVYLKKK